MPSYTKLFGSIIASTIWLEPDHTRLVWITMLALADRNGEVHASVPGLAKLAGVPVDSCRVALESLLSADPDSRSKALEGRRIVEIDGGWELVNHSKYRELASTADAIEANRLRQARFRDRNASVTPRNASVTPRNKNVTKAEAEADPTPPPEVPPSPSTPPAWMSGFAEFWAAYPRKKEKGDAEKAWKKQGCAKIVTQILIAIRDAKISADWLKESGRFIPYPSKWLNRRGWEDELLRRAESNEVRLPTPDEANAAAYGEPQ
jgi:hypothetical protein